MGTPRWRRGALAGAYAALVLAGLWLGPELFAFVRAELTPTDPATVVPMLVVALIAYLLTSALPFVPGAEIGMALLVVFGGRVAWLVYLGMVGALLIAFAVGRAVPLPALRAALRFLHLRRAEALVAEAGASSPAAWAAQLRQRAPGRVAPLLLRHRYLALAVLFNLPGNSLLGGGGGIAMTAGMSRLYSPTGYVLTVLLAVAPVPLLAGLLAEV